MMEIKIKLIKAHKEHIQNNNNYNNQHSNNNFYNNFSNNNYCFSNKGIEIVIKISVIKLTKNKNKINKNHLKMKKIQILKNI